MKWEDLNWKIIALGFISMMLVMYLLGCTKKYHAHSCPSVGHGPCYLEVCCNGYED